MKTACAALLILGAIAVFWPTNAVLGAEQPSQEGSIGLQLNAMEQRAEDCRLIFLFENRLSNAIDELVLELVIFGTDQRIERLIKIGVGALPERKSRVKQYDLKGLSCSNIGRLLLNDMPKCSGGGLEPKTCLKLAKPASTQPISFDY